MCIAVQRKGQVIAPRNQFACDAGFGQVIAKHPPDRVDAFFVELPLSMFTVSASNATIASYC
jgi:hypothetical protein